MSHVEHDDTLARVREQIVEVSRRTDLSDDSHLAQHLDSMGVMVLVVWIEKTYGFDVEIDDIVPENFLSIDALAAYIDRKRPR